jgi:hypothetical protein
VRGVNSEYGCGLGTASLVRRFLSQVQGRGSLELEPVITELKGKGLSLAKIAVELNKRKVATPRQVGSLVSGECAATSRGLKRIKSQDISFQAGMIRR